MEQTETGVKQGARDFQGTPAREEESLRYLYLKFSEAIKAKDVEKIMSFYAPEVVAFDVVPPLQYVGREEFRKSWERFVPEMKSVETHEVKELKIVASDTVAFGHGLVHMAGTMRNGQKMDSWMRLSNGFRKVNGRWMIAHEQISVPVDMETGRALWDLKPERSVH